MLNLLLLKMLIVVGYYVLESSSFVESVVVEAVEAVDLLLLKLLIVIDEAIDVL